MAVHPSRRRNQGTDPVSGLPLRLRTDIRGNVLRALDAAHVDAVEAYVSAVLRPPARGNGTPASRLPAWIKSAKNRREVLLGPGGRRDLLPADGAPP
ncbi:hypothetical protein [Kitasatospora sp. NPDC007106]|uniref:hypothetical protein n=1 Tax=Kitasatospora sp. NPDC007106 TaxID=3156914 RepID=UPI0033DF6294